MDTPRLETTQFRSVEDRQVPMSALLVSVLALAVAGAGNWFWPERLPDYFALLWLLALVPPFLLAYYRGWEGAALALAAGMVLLIGVEVGGSFLTDRSVRWWIVSGVIVVLILVCLGAGFTAEKLHRQTDEALELAYADPLTGLPNRRILDLFLQKEFAAAERGGALSIVLFDIDDFKRYNDTRGHSAGDEIIRLVAGRLAENTRTANLSGRQGGDEFLALLPGERPMGAVRFAERVREAVCAAAEARNEDVSVSCGVGVYDPTMRTLRDLLDAADRALYAAKRRGGNGVVVNAAHLAPEEFAGERVLILDGSGELRETPGTRDLARGGSSG